MVTLAPFTSRPEVETIVYRRKPACKFTAPDRLGRCTGRKHLYVGEARLRVASGKRSWEAAREFATNWQDDYDPAKIGQREQAARERLNHKLVEDASRRNVDSANRTSGPPKEAKSASNAGALYRTSRPLVQEAAFPAPLA